MREEEKANIAREIHDDLGGTLTALRAVAFVTSKSLTAIVRAGAGTVVTYWAKDAARWLA